MDWKCKVRIPDVALDEAKRLRKDIILDPEREHLVGKMFEFYATGNYSYTAIRDEMIELGLTTKKGLKTARSVIEYILKDSFYCGIAVSKKYGSYPHKYPSFRRVVQQVPRGASQQAKIAL